MRMVNKFAFSVSCLCLSASDHALAQSAASAFTTGYRYDAARLLTGLIQPDPGTSSSGYPATRNTYDADGNLVKVEQGVLSSWKPETIAPNDWGADFAIFQTATTEYDSLNRKVKDVVLGSALQPTAVTQYSYDTAGRLNCTAVRMNPGQYSAQADACVQSAPSSTTPDRITLNIYDAADQLLQVHKGMGSNVQQAYATYSYTPNGKVEYTIDANGNRAKMGYDGFDRLKNWIFPSPVRPTAYNPSNQANALATAGAANGNDYEQYGYDANGNRISLRKRDGSTLTYQYDALNRMIVKGVPERSGLAGTHTRDVFYSYDARGLMTAARFDGASGADSATTAYDGFGRISSATIAMDAGSSAAISRTLSYAYDADGNRTRITHPDGVYFRSSYDALDRLTSYWWNSPGGTEVAFGGVTYKTNGQRNSIVHGSSTTAYDYGADQRLSYLGQSFYNNVGNGTQTFAYNPAGQLAQDTRDNNAAFTFTARYNVSRNYDANGLNQYAGTTSTTAAGTSSNLFCHDANGNLTADGVYVYLYDVENRLVEKRQRATTSCASFAFDGPLMAQLRYDPMGRLYETVGIATGTTRMLYDGDKLAAEYDGTGALLRRYFWGDRTDEPVLYSEGPNLDCANSRTQFLSTDRQGSVVASADCYGNFIRAWRYDEYGIPQSSDGSALRPSNGARFLYTGQAFIPDAGLYYYKARMYSPSLGRFLQTDPIGYKDQINLYAYVGNDSMNASDPNGTETITYDRYGNAHILVQMSIVDPTGKNPTTVAQVGAAAAVQLAGQSSNGEKLTVSVVDSKSGVTATVDPKLNSSSSIGIERPHTDAIGGSKVSLAVDSGTGIVNHELGHHLGAGDQYAGGIGVDGKTLTAAAPGSNSGSLMRNVGGSLNNQSVDEILSSSHNKAASTPIDMRCESNGRGC